MKHFLNLIIAGLIMLTGCSPQKKGIWSEWQLQNRADNTYLYDAGGVCKSEINPTGDAAIWLMESNGKYTRIKNKKTGNYLSADANGGITIVSDSLSPSSHWNFGGYDWDHMKNCGWYNLSTEVNPKFFLTSSDKVAMKETDIYTDFSAHWTFIRSDGSQLPFEITSDGVKEASFLGFREAKYVSDDEISSNYHGDGNSWKRKLDISHFPQLKADNNKLLVALYNMALEEVLLDIRQQDSTFQAGALWPDTWTRDAVYSIHLAYAMIMPEISRKTLEKQTLSNPKEALQDTGSGGSWPISTDRVVWAMAAWEYYLASGDTGWLEFCYESLSYTAEKDIHVAYDSNINLFRGETCSMDWRTHTYPNWYTNANIGESYSCGTNALHFFLYTFLTKSGKLLDKPQQEIATWEKYAAQVKDAINKNFWMENKGYYSSYMHPQMENYLISQRGGAMPNGLSMYLGVAGDKQLETASKQFPLYAYGAPTLYPSIPDDFAYHNKGIWPVWESYFMLGAHKAGNMAATEHIMKSIIRQGAMFLTNKENMTYDTGYDRNTALNSDRQLWSVAASLGVIYKIIFGMELTTEGLAFNPMVPDLFKGPFELTNFKLRDAELDIVVKGNGDKISSLMLDGKKQQLPFILPYSTTGKHQIEIEMVSSGKPSSCYLVAAVPGKCWSPVEPVLSLEGNELKWEVETGLTYMLWDGKSKKAVNSPVTIDPSKFGAYNIFSVDSKGFDSDLSNPIIIAPDKYRYEAETAKNKNKGQFSNVHPQYSGNGFVVDLAAKPADLRFDVDIPQGKAGKYAIKITGANGHGPDQTFCYIRSVFVDEKDAGTFILEASGDWNKWMDSNYIFLDNLSEGKHTIGLRLNPENKGWDNNMSRVNQNANDANIDYLELIRM